MRVVERGCTGDYSEIVVIQFCGITHIVPIESKVVTAAKHHEQNPGCHWRSYIDLFQRMYKKGILSACSSHSCCAIRLSHGSLVRKQNCISRG